MHTSRNHLRFGLVFLSFIGLLLIFSVKLVLIQIFQSDHLAKLAEKQHNHVVELEPIRGTIYDRNMRPLAMNVSVYSLYANPRRMRVEDKERAVSELSILLELDPEFLRKRLSRDKFFVWLKRKLPQPSAEMVKNLKIRGLSFIRESKRFYPNGPLAAHIIGFAGMDNQGLEGIELVYNERLKGEAGKALILRDARHQELMLEKDFISPKDGHDVVLTIDETIQFIAEKALDEAYQKHNAKAATIIVMDVVTGEILALANRPTYNLEEVNKSSVESRTNRAVSFVYEPGSVFKIIPAAAALEENYFQESDSIFCENGEYRIANHILHDHKPHGKLSFQEVFEVSSNIGVAKISEKMGADMIYKYGKRFRFGERTGIDLRGEVSGWLKDPKQWSKTSIGAIPMGHEVTVTPIQLAASISAVANGGEYMRPFVVKYVKDKNDEILDLTEPQMVDRVVSRTTADRLKKILQAVVDQGTGQRAQIDGVSVAGKTGTAQKVVDGMYSHSKFHATFFGFAPVENPRVAAVVIYDEPYPSYYGGTVSAPVFQTVVEDALKYLQMSQMVFTQNQN